MSEYLNKARELQQMIGQGKADEAFEKFYHNDCTIIEANGDTRQGKEAQRKAIGEWRSNVKEMHGGGVGAIAADEKNAVTTAETWMDITMQNGHRMKMEEVAVQKWKDGQIINERFYYNMPAPPPQK